MGKCFWNFRKRTKQSNGKSLKLSSGKLYGERCLASESKDSTSIRPLHGRGRIPRRAPVSHSSHTLSSWSHLTGCSERWRECPWHGGPQSRQARSRRVQQVTCSGRSGPALEVQRGASRWYSGSGAARLSASKRIRGHICVAQSRSTEHRFCSAVAPSGRLSDVAQRGKWFFASGDAVQRRDPCSPCDPDSVQRSVQHSAAENHQRARERGRRGRRRRHADSQTLSTRLPMLLPMLLRPGKDALRCTRRILLCASGASVWSEMVIAVISGGGGTDEGRAVLTRWECVCVALLYAWRRTHRMFHTPSPSPVVPVPPAASTALYQSVSL